MMQGYQQLAAQTVDAVVYDKPMIEYFIANHPHKNFMIMQGRPLDPNDYAIGVNLADSELLAHINQLLDYLNKTGELQKLAAKYSTASLIVEAAQQVEVTTDYTVKSGDTLSMIAFKVYGDPSLWEIIYAYNFQLKLIEYASLIRAGQTIKIPKRTQVD
jgi:nucleoid-associated protein YgaU